MLTATETTPAEAKDQVPDEAKDPTPDKVEEEKPDKVEEEKTVSFRLARFVAVLVLSREKLEFFLDYPDLAMDDANLPEEERALLADDHFEKLCRYLAEVGPKPTAPDPPPPPPPGG